MRGVVVRTAVVATCALGSGVAGLTAVGLFALSVRVAVGVANGELDMNAKRAPVGDALTPWDIFKR